MSSVSSFGWYLAVMLLCRDQSITSILPSLPAPIVITEHPPVYQKLTGVQRANFSVTFTGREAQGIETMWYHNGVILNDKQHQLVTSFSSESLTGMATIKFDQMARGDRGVYRVVVETDFGAEVIDVSLRKKEYSFQVDVRGKYHHHRPTCHLSSDTFSSVSSPTQPSRLCGRRSG